MKTSLDISCESSAKQTIHMKCQDLLSLKKLKQEAHGPQLTHLSETAIADMQMACNIFPTL